MKRIIIPILVLVYSSVYAQQRTDDKPVRCINEMEYEHEWELKDTNRRIKYEATQAAMNKWVREQQENRADNVQTQYTIPVVFHVLWNSDSIHEKISYAQIKRQLNVMNADYNRMNADTVNTPGAFKPAAASFHITFCLAQRDPNDNATTGVVYKQTSVNSFSEQSPPTQQAMKCPSLGGDTIWDPDKYLNIWVCNLSGGLLGYSELPAAPLDNTFGSVVLFQAIGDSGYLPYSEYNKGRTITHEVGHLLNLHHPWGDDGGLCPPPQGSGVDDGCADTPPEGNMTYGSPTFPHTDNCSTTSPGIMFENFMEYTDDRVMNIFTNDQYTRVLAAIAGPLTHLVNSNGCNPASVVDIYNFDNSVNVYPNPSSTGRFNVATTLSNFQHINAIVYNVLGQTLATWSSDGISNSIYDLNLSSQPDGLYFVKLYNNDFSVVKKIMISR
jgi:hypothetical protein